MPNDNILPRKLLAPLDQSRAVLESETTRNLSTYSVTYLIHPAIWSGFSRTLTAGEGRAGIALGEMRINSSVT